MDNEVRIRVTVDDDTRRGFTSARVGIEGEAKRAGPQIGGMLGAGIADGTARETSKAAPDIGKRFGEKIGSSASESVTVTLRNRGSRMGGEMAKVLGAAIGNPVGLAVVTSMIGTIGALVSTSAATLGIGAAIAAGIHRDQELAQAGKDLGTKFVDGFAEIAATSLAGPIEKSFTGLSAHADEVIEHWGDALRQIAPNVAPFIDSLGTGLSALSADLAEITAESGPVLNAFGDSFEELARDIGDSLKIITEDVDGNAQSIRVFFGFLGEEMKSLSQFFVDAGTDIREELEMWGVWDDIVNKYGGGTKQIRRWTQDTADAFEQAAKAADGERQALIALSSELRGQADPVFAILQAQRDLKEAQEETAEATRKHGKSSDEAKEALVDQAMAALELEEAAGELGNAFRGEMTPAMEATLRAAGLTDGAIRALKRQFADAKKAGDDFAGTYTAHARATGIGTARNALYSVRDAANDIPRAVNVAIRITGDTNVSRQIRNIEKNMATGGIRGSANNRTRSSANGATNDGLTWVGEHGPELVDLPPGSRVHSNPDSQRMAQGAGSGGGWPGPLQVQLVLADGRVLAETVVDPMRDIVRTQFGGSVQEALGVG